MSVRSVQRGVLALVCLLPAAACEGPLSTLNPAGTDAATIARLFWWMASISAIVWAALVGLTTYASATHRRTVSRRATSLLIILGGVVVPTMLLGVLLFFGLRPLARTTSSDIGQLTIDVAGEQWWWRVRYRTADGRTVESANELRLPVRERVTVRLTSDNVIHSFWIPSLAGKVDMIPGRVTTLSLEPTRPGVFRGACAEYCGASHALMAFPVIVLDAPEFETWLAGQSRPAAEPVRLEAIAGRDLFLSNGCGACHTIRGTPAAGVIGPDLTHLGRRTMLGAGTLPNAERELARWIANPGAIKPHVQMPAFAMLDPGEIGAMASYLSGRP